MELKEFVKASLLRLLENSYLKKKKKDFILNGILEMRLFRIPSCQYCCLLKSLGSVKNFYWFTLCTMKTALMNLAVEVEPYILSLPGFLASSICSHQLEWWTVGEADDHIQGQLSLTQGFQWWSCVEGLLAHSGEKSVREAQKVLWKDIGRKLT